MDYETKRATVHWQVADPFCIPSTLNPRLSWADVDGMDASDIS